jgi:toxin secretion/phage lysis holin
MHHTNQKNEQVGRQFSSLFFLYSKMKGEIILKSVILAFLGTAGAFIASLYGGWGAALTTLVIFMAIDYATGLIVAGVFKKSPKSASGALESRAGLKGLFKKAGIMMAILVAVRLDMLSGTTVLKDAVIIAFIVNEAISIIENTGLMGVQWPPVITNALDLLKKKQPGSDVK